MKRGYSRFRIMLMAFGLGIAAVYMWQGLSVAWWGVPVDLPEARSASVLEVTVPLEEKPRGPDYLCDEHADPNDRAVCLDQVIFEGRDISLYDDGGRQGCGLVNPLSCERSMEKARRFVWEHWKKRKRGHVAIARASVENGEWVTHLFIEPNADGSWRVDARWVPMLRDAEKLEHYLLGDLVEIKWRHATADDENWGVRPGTLYLRLSNITGDGLIL
jgi:hypothetical protein